MYENYRKILTDVCGGSGIGGRVAKESAVRRQHTHDDVIVATRKKVINDQIVASTTGDSLALIVGVYAVVPAHLEATRAPIIFILTPTHMNAVWSVGRDNDGGRRQRLWMGG